MSYSAATVQVAANHFISLISVSTSGTCSSPWNIKGSENAQLLHNLSCYLSEHPSSPRNINDSPEMIPSIVKSQYHIGFYTSLSICTLLGGSQENQYETCFNKGWAMRKNEMLISIAASESIPPKYLPGFIDFCKTRFHPLQTCELFSCYSAGRGKTLSFTHFVDHVQNLL